jgi:hypothetical protein
VSRPGRTLPPGKTRYPLYRRLGGPLGPSGQVRKISPSPGFDPRTVQPEGSRYTDYATQLLFTVMFAISVTCFGHVIHSNGKDSHCLPIVLVLLCESETKGLN